MKLFNILPVDIVHDFFNLNLYLLVFCHLIVTLNIQSLQNVEIWI